MEVARVVAIVVLIIKTAPPEKGKTTLVVVRDECVCDRIPRRSAARLGRARVAKQRVEQEVGDARAIVQAGVLVAKRDRTDRQVRPGHATFQRNLFVRTYGDELIVS